MENAPTTDYLATDKAMNLKPNQLILGAVVILILVLGFVLYRSQGPSISADSQTTADSPVTTMDNTSSAPSGADYTTTIPTDEIVSTISAKLGVSINQDDPTRGITVPDISSEVDIWSAPYITLLIYPDANALTLDKDNFQSDADNLNGSRSWESCKNLIVINPPSKQSKIVSAMSNWCTFSSL